MVEPITMMLGLAAIQGLTRVVLGPIADKVAGKHEKSLELQNNSHALNVEAIRFTKECDYENALKLRKLDFEISTKLKLLDSVRDHSLQLLSHKQRLEMAEAEFRRNEDKYQKMAFNAEVWPIRAPYGSFFLEPVCIQSNAGMSILPTRLFTSRAESNTYYGRQLEARVNTALARFIEEGYADGASHPTTSNIGLWKDNAPATDGFINALWFGLSNQPVVVVTPVANGDTVEFRFSMWGLSSHKWLPSPSTKTALRIPLNSMRCNLLRDATRTLRNLGVQVLSEELKCNIALLEDEERIGEPVHAMQYRPAPEIAIQVDEQLAEQIGNAVSCVTGAYNDAIHLVEYGTPPLMPARMLTFAPNYAISPSAAQFYRGALEKLAASGYHAGSLLETYASTAQALAMNTSTTATAVDLVCDAILLWSGARAPEPAIAKHLSGATLSDCIELAYKHVRPNDRALMAKLGAVLSQANENAAGRELACIPDLARV